MRLSGFYFYLIIFSATSALAQSKMAKDSSHTMSHHQIILTPNAPQPIGAYSQAIRDGDFLFCSGQIGIDPKTGTLKNSSIEEEAEQVLNNVHEVLIAAGADFSSIMKTTIFLTNMNDFTKVNEVYARILGGAKPARSTVAVAALPKGARIEIECIAKAR